MLYLPDFGLRIQSYQLDPIFHPSVLRVICKPINYGVVSMEYKVGLLVTNEAKLHVITRQDIV